MFTSSKNQSDGGTDAHNSDYELVATVTPHDPPSIPPPPQPTDGDVVYEQVH